MLLQDSEWIKWWLTAIFWKTVKAPFAFGKKNDEQQEKVWDFFTKEFEKCRRRLPLFERNLYAGKLTAFFPNLRRVSTAGTGQNFGQKNHQPLEQKLNRNLERRCS